MYVKKNSHKRIYIVKNIHTIFTKKIGTAKVKYETGDKEERKKIKKSIKVHSSLS